MDATLYRVARARAPLAAWRPTLATGLGTDFTVNLPVVGAQTVSIPVDDIARQVVEAAWPALKQKLESDVQPRIDDAVSAIKRTYFIVGIATITASLLAAIWVRSR